MIKPIFIARNAGGQLWMHTEKPTKQYDGTYTSPMFASPLMMTDFPDIKEGECYKFEVTDKESDNLAHNTDNSSVKI